MDLYAFDAQLRLKYSVLCGCDEAGRGPLAGPVIAAAVILNYNSPNLAVNDSKTLSEKLRNKLYVELCHSALTFSIAQSTVAEIETLNILGATKSAMIKAVNHLGIDADLLLIDGNQSINHPIKQQTLIKGDKRSACIAAASILAKVSRDKIMDDLHVQYPEYGFAEHKGYATKKHRQALLKHGPCPEHRTHFLRNLFKHEYQTDIFL